jgi:pyrroline-5-carboxylate reductase
VASPGGTTIEGIHTLEKLGFRNSAIAAVEASTMKSIKLG